MLPRALSICAGALILAGFAPRAALAAPPDAGTPQSATADPAVLPANTSQSSSKDPGFSERLILETGRIPAPPREPDTITFTSHGEYELRYRAMNDLRLEAPQDRPSLDSLGQNQYLYHWLRLNPRLQWKQSLAIVGQIDVRGLVLGDTTTLVDKTRDALNERRWYEVHPRYLYMEYQGSAGLLRIGQQGSHWGMGILANDGDHRSLFGDYRRGALVDRVLFATRPFGSTFPVTLAAAGDFVFEDNTADVIDDHDVAVQTVVALLWKNQRAELGVYGVFRGQSREAQSESNATPFAESIRAGIVDVTGKVNGRAPGSLAYVYAEAEAAAIFGATNYIRNGYDATTVPGSPMQPEAIRSFGAATTLGVVRDKGRGRDRFGSFVAEVEWGYATGDADPYDGVSSRFTFDANHRVGLLLFDQVLAWKTARAATLAQDPGLVRRPAPGLSFLPTKGGVAGATYLNPRVIIRPKKSVDLKAGVVVAQATSDFVDPYHAGVLGSYATYDGGDEQSHDLGLELDLGVDARVNVSHLVNIDLGAEGGVLFPGRAFDDASQRPLGTMYLANIKLGVNF